MKFKPGQKVVCTAKRWFSADTSEETIGPKFNEIVTVFAYTTYERFPGEKFIRFIEYLGCNKGNDDFNEIDFEPLITDAQLEKELETIEQFV